MYVFYGNRKIHAAVYNACCFCKSEGDQCAYWLIHRLGVSIYFVYVCMWVRAESGCVFGDTTWRFGGLHFVCTVTFLVFLQLFSVCAHDPAGVIECVQTGMWLCAPVYICVHVWMCVCDFSALQRGHFCIDNLLVPVIQRTWVERPFSFSLIKRP